MATRNNKLSSIRSIDESTDIVDAFYDLIKEKARTLNFKTIVRPLGIYIDKHNHILTDLETFGDQLLFNDDMENYMFKILNIKYNDIKRVVDNNEYYKKNIGGDFKLKHQFIVSIPYLLLSKAYVEMKKEKQAKQIFVFAYYKPYSSLVFKYFNNHTGVNRDRMNYTIENLSNKYSLKVLGSVQAVIEDKALGTYENYVYKNPLMISATDKGLQQIFSSGIYTKINTFLNKIKAEYEKNKGKYLRYEEEIRDSESGSYHLTTSVSLNKNNIARRAEKHMMSKPIDDNILDMIVGKKKTKIGTMSNMYGIEISRKALKITLERIRDEKYKEFFEFFDAILTVFFLEKTKIKNDDIKTPVFIKTAIDIYQMSNSKSESIETIKRLIKSWLIDCSSYYITRQPTQQSGIQKAVFLYFIIILQKS